MTPCRLQSRNLPGKRRTFSVVDLSLLKVIVLSIMLSTLGFLLFFALLVLLLFLDAYFLPLLGESSVVLAPLVATPDDTHNDEKSANANNNANNESSVR